MPLIRGVKLGPSGSKQREDRASEKLLPARSPWYTVSVWSPLVTMSLFSYCRRAA